MKEKRTQIERLLHKVPLTELVDVSVLQRLQDWFAAMSGISAIVRDLEGRPVTRPSFQNAFCRMIMSSSYGEKSCRASNLAAVRKAAREHKVVKYICHAGLAQFAAPIEVEGVCIGTLVMGDRPEGEVDEKSIAGLARRMHIRKNALRSALGKVKPWSEEEMSRSVSFLQSIANAVAELCYRGMELRAKLEEINSLYEVTRLLASTLNMDKLLDLVARSATELVGAKGCSIRIVDARRKELRIKSFYNLSQRYLDKGPVLIGESPIDQEALHGKVVQIQDMRTDPRVLYPKEAAMEGIRSGFIVGLISKRRHIGTLHLYSSEPRVYDETEVALIRSLANQAAVAIENAQLYRQSVEKQRLDRELRVAAEIQTKLLPEESPEIPGFKIAAKGIPCHEVGGDFYDFIPIGKKRTAIIIADVAGKGVPGALLMASARASLRAHFESTSEPREALRRLNRNLCHDARSGQFVSLFCGIIDRDKRTLTYSNAGHNPPIIVRDGRMTMLETGGMVLGADENETYEQESVPLESGDLITLYTDGVTEAANPREQLFGVGRLIRVLRTTTGKSAEATIRKIQKAVDKFTQGAPHSDDITLLAIAVE